MVVQLSWGCSEPAGQLVVTVLGVVTQRRVIAVDVKTDHQLAVPLHRGDSFAVRDGRTRRFVSEYIRDAIYV